MSLAVVCGRLLPVRTRTQPVYSIRVYEAKALEIEGYE